MKHRCNFYEMTHNRELISYGITSNISNTTLLQTEGFTVFFFAYNWFSLTDDFHLNQNTVQSRMYALNIWSFLNTFWAVTDITVGDRWTDRKKKTEETQIGITKISNRKKRRWLKKACIWTFFYHDMHKLSYLRADFPINQTVRYI